MRPAARPKLLGRDVRHIHCVGVGGMGVAPLAIYLAQAGFTVSGEDDGLTEDVRALLRPVLADDAGNWSADYVRLRFAATKP